MRSKVSTTLCLSQLDLIEQLAQLVERSLDVGKVTGSIPVLLIRFLMRASFNVARIQKDNSAACLPNSTANYHEHRIPL